MRCLICGGKSKKDICPSCENEHRDDKIRFIDTFFGNKLFQQIRAEFKKKTVNHNSKVKKRFLPKILKERKNGTI